MTINWLTRITKIAYEPSRSPTGGGGTFAPQTGVAEGPSSQIAVVTVDEPRRKKRKRKNVDQKK